MTDNIHFTLAVWQQITLAVVAWYLLAIPFIRFTVSEKEKECAGGMFLYWVLSPLLIVLFCGMTCVFLLLKGLGAKVTWAKFCNN